MKRHLSLISAVFLVAIPLIICAAPRPARRDKDNQVDEAAVADSLARVEAEKYLSIGVDFYRKNLYDEAIENYQKALQQYPDYYAAMVAMARTYQDLKDLTQAEEWYTKVYETHPDSVAGYLGLGGIFLIKATMNPTYYDSALAVYQEGVDKFPDESDLYHGIANVFENKGGVEAADSVYAAGIEVNPENLALRNSYVNFLMDHGRYAEALENQAYIVKAEPEDPFARKKLGKIALELKKFEQATSELKTALELFGKSGIDNLEAYLLLGNIYLTQRKYASAEKLFKEAVVADTTKLVPRIYLGLTYLNWGKESRAESTFKEILSLDSDNGDALYFLGVIYTRRASRAVNQTTTEAWQRGCANARQAESYLRKSISANPESNTGRANEQIQHLEKVRAELKKKLFLEGITEC